MKFIGVVPKDLVVGPLWPQISALLERALPYGRGEYTLDDIREGIAGGRMFAIAVADESIIEFVATCVVVEFPRKRVLYVQYGAGRGGVRAREALVSAARTLECDWVETRTRLAVAKLCQRSGFDIGYCVPILEIDQ